MDLRRLATARRFGNHHLHVLAGSETVKTRPPQRRHVHEHVLAAVIRHDESETACRVVPFDDAFERLGWAACLAAAVSRWWTAGLRGRRIEVQDGNGGASFGALGALEYNRCSFGGLGEARAFQNRERQEHVPTPIRCYNKAKSLISIEPLDAARKARGFARREIALRWAIIAHDITDGSSALPWAPRPAQAGGRAAGRRRILLTSDRRREQARNAKQRVGD